MLESDAEVRPSFTSRVGSGGIRQFSARADHPQVTQLLVDGIRALPGPLGMVLVELGEPPREWVGDSLSRIDVLEAILALRDLLGRGGMDAAVFSTSEGVEIYLDRTGLAEFRTGGSWEPRARSLLEGRGFRWTSRLATVWAPPPLLSPEARERIAAVAAFLDLRATSPGYRARRR